MGNSIPFKQAKATEGDMEAAAVITGILTDVSCGNFPRASDGGQHPDDPGYFDPDNSDHLRAFYDRVISCMDSHPGALSRVVWGFHALMHNGLVDPARDYLAIHPRIERALEAYGVQAGQGAC